jgi:hypothetical protein
MLAIQAVKESAKALGGRDRQQAASTLALVGLTCADDSISRFECSHWIKLLKDNRFNRIQ